MSAAATAWALKQKTGGSGPKLALLVLADVADDDGHSWYGQERLAEMAEVDPKTIRTNLTKLEELKLLVRIPWVREDGGRDTDLHCLMIPGAPPPGDISEGRVVSRRGPLPKSPPAPLPETPGAPPPKSPGEPLVDPLEDTREGDLFGDPPEVAALLAELPRLCARLGTRRWPLRSQTMREWCRDLAADTRYAPLDLAEQARLCGEWWEPKVNGKGKQPHTTFRNWLNKALEIRASNGRGGPVADGAAFVDEENERWRKLTGGGRADV